MIRRLDLVARLTGLIKPSEAAEGLFVSYCPALRIYSQGMGQDDAREALRGAVILYLKGCWKTGILHDRLKALGEIQDDSSAILAPDEDIEKTKFPDDGHDYILVRETEKASISEEYESEFDVLVPLHLLGINATQGAACQP